MNDDDLRKAAQFPPPFERLFQEAQMFERSYVAHHGRARILTYLLPVKVLVMLGAVFVMGRTEGWIEVVAALVLLTFAAWGTMASLRRAQAYRNGWLDRGMHDVTEHDMVCGDPVAGDAFRHRMHSLNMESLL